MSGRGRSPLTRVMATWLAAGICASLALVFGVGYRVLGEWRATAVSLARHRAEESAGLLSTALLRDMRGVQESVLASSRLFAFVRQPAYDVRNEAAGAFARYPYPESFFSWRRGTAPAAMVFFNRGGRRPSWMDVAEDSTPAPVLIESHPHVAALLLARITKDIERRRPLAAFEMSIGGTPYQVIAQLVYNDVVGDDLEAIVGFTVNLPWVRQHYFPGDTIVSGRASGAILVECAHLLVQESKRLTRLVDNLLAYSRITDVTDVYLFEPMNVSALVDEILEGFAWQLRDLQFVVEVDIPPDLPRIRGDRTALRLAFDNVVDNAIRYSADVRSLKLTATTVNGGVAVTVLDRGVGIPADELSVVTRRFFRGRGAKTGGSGLGLTIALRIVSDHGGTLTVSSEVGRGTTMRITLPQARSDHG